MRCLALLLLLLAVPLTGRAQPVAIMPAICVVPSDFAEPEAPLLNLEAALAAGGPVHLLAVGSGTTVGEVNGAPGTSFPYRMLASLQAAKPTVKFDLTVQGGHNMTAATMLGLIKTELPKRHYAVVVWQTGTVEAVRGLRPDTMRSVLEEGVDAVAAADGDLVLIDSQFSRFLRANTDIDPYQSVMQQVATLPGAVLFHRFDVTRAWADDGRIDLERVAKPEREQAVAQLNTCLGAALADFLLSGAAQAAH
jgi:hypothetical protein